MIKIYHNPRCRKSRETLELLQKKTKSFKIVDYIKNPITTDELEKILTLLKIDPQDLLRKTEPVYKEKCKKLELDYDELVLLMIEYPKLMQRPIVLNGNKAAIGRPPENILKIIK